MLLAEYLSQKEMQNADNGILYSKKSLMKLSTGVNVIKHFFYVIE